MNSESDADRQTQQGQTNPPLPAPTSPDDTTVLTEPETKPSADSETETEKLLRGTRTIEVLQFTANAALAIIGVIALYIYGGQLGVMRSQLATMNNQLSEMRGQTTINRQQLVGGQAAVLELSISFNDGSGELQVALNNRGHVTATNIHLRVEASKRGLRDGELIGNAFEFEPSVQPIGSERGFAQTWALPWRLTERERQQGGSWPTGWPGNKTYVFVGKVAYEDGFGDEVKQEVCQQWLPGFTIVYKAQSSGGGGLYDCAILRTS